MRAQEATRRADGIQANAVKQMLSRANDAGHPTRQSHGAEKAEIIKGDYPADFIGVGGGSDVGQRDDHSPSSGSHYHNSDSLVPKSATT